MKKKSARIILIIIAISLAIVLIPSSLSKYFSSDSRAIVISIVNPEYDLTFNSNPPSGKTSTGTVNSMHFVYDETKNLNKNAFKVKGYIFTGWNRNSGGSGSSYTDEQSVSNLTTVNNDNVVLYAQWRVATYAVVDYTGEQLMGLMKELSGSGSNYSTANNTVIKFLRATESQYNDAIDASIRIEKISGTTSPNDAYMWFDNVCKNVSFK